MTSRGVDENKNIINNGHYHAPLSPSRRSVRVKERNGTVNIRDRPSMREFEHRTPLVSPSPSSLVLAIQIF